MTTNREQGEKLLKEAEYIFEKDLKIAVDEENYNLAVRRAQEVVELTLKPKFPTQKSKPLAGNSVPSRI